MKRPSPALIIACVALFLSLGGVSYGVATGFIDSREIKNNTIRTKDIRNGQVTGADVRNNTVQGADINESSLAKVPSATSADSAASAANAATAGNAAHATTASNASNARCGGWGQGARDQRAPERGHALQRRSSASAAWYRDGVRDAAAAAATSPSAWIRPWPTPRPSAAGLLQRRRGPAATSRSTSAPNDFDPGEIAALGPGTDGFRGGLFGRYEINYVAPSGSVVTASFAVSETTNAFGGTADCILYGHARQSG